MPEPVLGVPVPGPPGPGKSGFQTPGPQKSQINDFYGPYAIHLYANSQERILTDIEVERYRDVVQEGFRILQTLASSRRVVDGWGNGCVILMRGIRSAN